MEIWWESREDLVEAMKGIATSGLIDDVRRSGEGLFAPQKVPAFTVTEYDSDMGTHG
jgi:hypothetical protein